MKTEETFPDHYQIRLPIILVRRIRLYQESVYKATRFKPSFAESMRVLIILGLDNLRIENPNESQSDEANSESLNS